ncbi:MAG: septum formation initiator family protein [Patescibacteria group bacterium]
MPLKKSSFFTQIISSKLFIITGIAVLIFFGVSLSKEFARRVEISQRVSSLNSEISSLEKRNTDLTALIDYLKSESYREREARLKLGLKKPGENIIILPEDNNVNTSTDSIESTASNADVQSSSPQKWWQYFFKN